jgi:hypothetical protein
MLDRPEHVPRTEHILLGLLEAHEEPGAQILADFGLSKADAETWIRNALAELVRKRTK